MRGGCRPPQGWAESSLHAPPGMLHLVGTRYIDSFRRTGNRLQIASRQVQIDRRIGQLGMSEKKLNGAKIRTGFQHVGCEAVSKRVWRDPLGDAGTLGRFGDSGPCDLVPDWYICSPVVLHAREQIGLG